ncbi:uncharacterized protein LOC133286049 isoform X2 [Gastrolobium bilobum]|uniref:uncharacterized protein LOC133286049 isoform X2 n=1 Tax=Gastrolobium bilobum TaxID=150636 RepID=UPI002AAF80FD|nr:uncharacterized protein LOC133286049 isoform X2 [Gastrolobium bilobum]
MANSHSNSDQDRVKRLEKKIEAQITSLEKMEDRLIHLQSSAFQLANYFFVFQGVILGVLCNRSTALKCSDSWFLVTLSVLAAFLNLAALVSLGTKYNRVITQRSKTWSNLHANLVDLELPENKPRTYTDYDDEFEKKTRKVVLCICIFIFVGFAIVVLVGCFKFLCRDKKYSAYVSREEGGVEKHWCPTVAFTLRLLFVVDYIIHSLSVISVFGEGY